MSRNAVKIITLGSEYALPLPAAKLGESPICTPDGDTLYYVDVPAGKIHSYEFSTKRADVIETGTNVSFVAPEADRPGVVVAGTGNGDIRRYEFGTTRNEVIARIKDPRPDERSNDGKVDPRGVLVAGTKGTDDGPNIGRLSWLLSPGGLTTRLDGVHISQGPAWSPNGETMYHNDSGAFLWSTPYDGGRSRPDADKMRNVFASMPKDGSVPDGLTVDAAGQIVLAKWSHTGDMGRVEIYENDKGKGRLVAMIELPTVLQASSVIFGGLEHKDLIITTANYGKSEERPDIYRDAGKIFVLPGVLAGLPATPFAGKNFPALKMG
ncbi:MAG: SMP-30/gluconolactonase/LRE family protein [Pseudomonadota bacterium]|nr:SMP-30/gluconolactonase/LRE family protein [Pseudomonadota bacterium]